MNKTQTIFRFFLSVGRANICVPDASGHIPLWRGQHVRKIIPASLIALGMLFITPLVYAESCVLDDAFWLQPRTGLMVLNEAAIKPCSLALLANDQRKMWIIYNDTDESSISATELRQWLVALALPAKRIILKRATTLTDPLRLEIQHD